MNTPFDEHRIIKREKKEEGEQYFVHYKGWKQTWDEWITEDRVLKYTDNNLTKQQQLKEMNTKRKPSRASTTLHETEARGRKRNHDATTEKTRTEEKMRKSDFKLNVPMALKRLLVEDWEYVTKNKQLLPLPKTKSVNDILKQYEEEQEEKNEFLDEFLAGVQLYFGKSLTTSLLYKSEYKQYEELKSEYPEKSSADLYGAEHLLRLFVEIPNLISKSNIDADTSNELKDRLERLLKFLEDHEKDYFIDYHQITI
ncbi:MRG-domain-containing protein [Backusella circina FSU 941]|nr:MRG-domain-containing protein [Backusella circina FSU 941]